MTEQKHSPRKQITVHLLQEALLSLLAHRNYMDITVCDLCEEAGVSRGTFYSHYKNISQIVDELFEDALSHIGNYPLQIKGSSPANSQCGMPLCLFLRTHTKYQPLFFSDSLYTQAVHRTVAALMEDFICKMQPGTGLSRDVLENLLYYQISGCLAVCRNHIRSSDLRWEEIRSTVDAFLSCGFRDIAK